MKMRCIRKINRYFVESEKFELPYRFKSHNKITQRISNVPLSKQQSILHKKFLKVN